MTITNDNEQPRADDGRFGAWVHSAPGVELGTTGDADTAALRRLKAAEARLFDAQAEREAALRAVVADETTRRFPEAARVKVEVEGGRSFIRRLEDSAGNFLYANDGPFEKAALSVDGFAGTVIIDANTTVTAATIVEAAESRMVAATAEYYEALGRDIAEEIRDRFPTAAVVTLDDTSDGDIPQILRIDAADGSLLWEQVDLDLDDPRLEEDGSHLQDILASLQDRWAVDNYLVDSDPRSYDNPRTIYIQKWLLA